MKKKILFFLPSFAGGGAEKVAISFINNISIERYDIHLAVLNETGKLRKSLNPNVKLHNLRVARLRYAIFKIILVINKVKPNIIFSTFINMNVLLLFLKLFYKKISFIIRAESVPSTHFNFLPYSFFYKFCYQKLYKTSNHLIASCKMIEDEFLECGAKKETIKLIPNPVENIIKNNDGKIIRHQGSGIRVVAAGRLSHQKGYDYLLEVLSKLNIDIHCTILGEGELENELKSLAKNLKVCKKVKFQGYVDNPYPYLNGADALLITSNFEGLPNIALESLSLGTPVIATPNCGGLKELKNASIYPKGDEFLHAVKEIKVNINNSKSTLLDNRFNIENVMKKFMFLLDYNR